MMLTLGYITAIGSGQIFREEKETVHFFAAITQHHVSISNTYVIKQLGLYVNLTPYRMQLLTFIISSVECWRLLQ